MTSKNEQEDKDGKNLNPGDPARYSEILIDAEWGVWVPCDEAGTGDGVDTWSLVTLWDKNQLPDGTMVAAFDLPTNNLPRDYIEREFGPLAPFRPVKP